MADTIQDVNQSINDLSVTDSGLIEKATLVPALLDITGLLQFMGMPTYDDVAAMQAADPEDGLKAVVRDAGLFVYTEPVPGVIPSGSYPANNGIGYWRKQELSSLSSLLDVALSTPTNGQVLRFNSSTGKWENGNQSISALAWSAITGTPTTLAGYLNSPNAAVVQDFSVGRDVSVTRNFTISGNISGSGSISASAISSSTLASTGNLTVGGTAQVTGNLSTSANLTVQGSASVTGAITSSAVISGTNGSFSGAISGASLALSGNATVNGTTNIVGNTGINGTANVLGKTTIGDQSVSGSGGLDVLLGPVRVYQSLQVLGPSSSLSSATASSLRITALSVYSSNADAISNGVPVGTVYRITGTGNLAIVY